VFRILAEGADIDFRDAARLRTPLMWAAARGRTLLCRRLLHAGCTAAQLAESNHHLRLAQLLQAADAERLRDRSFSAHLRRSWQRVVQHKKQVLLLLRHVVLVLAVATLALFSQSLWLAPLSATLTHVLPALQEPSSKLWMRLQRRSKSAIAPMPDEG
ncbi:unnamed protein product, partial [Effrenium voratum]